MVYSQHVRVNCSTTRLQMLFLAMSSLNERVFNFKACPLIILVQTQHNMQSNGRLGSLSKGSATPIEIRIHKIIEIVKLVLIVDDVQVNVCFVESCARVWVCARCCARVLLYTHTYTYIILIRFMQMQHSLHNTFPR